MHQEELAKALGVSTMTVGRWERGERVPGLEHLEKILERFPEINPSWLVAGEGPMLRGSGGEFPEYPLDGELFAQVTEAVLEEVENYARPPRAKTLMQLIRLIHDEIREGEMEEQEVKKNVKRFLKIAS
jgi:transcriptional regulator with XRE-family HTH domain